MAQRRRAAVLPGFGLSLGLTLSWTGLLVLLPLLALALKASTLGAAGLWAVARDPRVVAAVKLSLGASVVAAAINAVFGSIVAWVLTRYAFPGRRLLDALVDLPFALPTAVSGIALTQLWGPKGPLGALVSTWGQKVAFTQAGVVVALVLIGLPFVVRTLQPALDEIEPELEEAAASLGASRGQTFWRLLVPALLPAWVTGFTLAFARAIGEYGSVVFIAGNMPMKTEIVPLLIIIKLEQYDYAGATAVAVIMLTLSFSLLFGLNRAQSWQRRRLGGA